MRAMIIDHTLCAHKDVRNEKQRQRTMLKRSNVGRVREDDVVVVLD
jgi:hypothetical protein